MASNTVLVIAIIILLLIIGFFIWILKKTKVRTWVPKYGPRSNNDNWNSSVDYSSHDHCDNHDKHDFDCGEDD